MSSFSDSAALLPERSSERPLVSIGVPVFNGAHFLPVALESLLALECADFELLISDNASTDETAAICPAFAARDHRIPLVTQPRNIGALPDFGVVLEEARGEFFVWAAADDRWHPQFTARLVAELRAGPDAGLALSAVQRITEAGEEVDMIRFKGSQNPSALNSRARCGWRGRLARFRGRKLTYLSPKVWMPRGSRRPVSISLHRKTAFFSIKAQHSFAAH